jgi:hypothetical protein
VKCGKINVAHLIKRAWECQHTPVWQTGKSDSILAEKGGEPLKVVNTTVNVDSEAYDANHKAWVTLMTGVLQLTQFGSSLGLEVRGCDQTRKLVEMGIEMGGLMTRQSHLKQELVLASLTKPLISNSSLSNCAEMS